uniref:Integrase catalytic domain-containing protein n=1 Tax=Chromera velia CCMP2878 TaxID=1169474 RepID=A0A0G4IA55_9ALVE|eukprot:Cvel_12464.t1-p1 / transcript=Cvel_12464.t1 / gene=Cvel_12464 / organism=Chromera_velia_CCMP2878 / gene_product=hypothetical protein / transcript_product=hypothetical protein / location=Cvel_scaffold817:24571-28373(+) / protein_length=950 / sequence_SO=supercontig / SO=protein_coding / is_pseudo=false
MTFRSHPTVIQPNQMKAQKNQSQYDDRIYTDSCASDTILCRDRIEPRRIVWEKSIKLTIGVSMKEEVRKKVWRECELCEDRNAVNKTPHAVSGRREKEAKEYGQLAYYDIGQLVGYPFSVIVEIMHSREIDMMGLNAKSDVMDHCVRFNAQNRLLLPKPYRQIVTMRSDNENVLRSAKMKATTPYTHFDESTKYHSPSQGPVEAAVKMIKRLARIMMKEKGWPLAVLPHLWEGLAKTYMALRLHMNELGTSPYYKKNGQHPPLKFMCGDKVIFTPHRAKTAKKTEAGKSGWYISRPSPHAVRVLEIWSEGPNDFTVQTVHPVNVYQSRKGTLATWGYEGVDKATRLLLVGVIDTGLEPQAEEGVWVSPKAQEREGKENAEQLKEEKRGMEKGEDEDSSDSSDDDFLLLLQAANTKRGSAHAQQPPAAVAAPRVQPQAAAAAQGGQVQGPTPPPSLLPQQRAAAAIRSSAGQQSVRVERSSESAKASAPSPSGASGVEGRVESDGAGALQTDETGRRPSGGTSASDTGEREKRERGKAPQVMGRQQQLGGRRTPSIAQGVTIKGMAGRKEKEKEREQTGRAPQNNATMFRSGVSLRPATRGEIESGRFKKSRLNKFCELLENGVFSERVTRQEVVAVTNMGEYAGVKKKPGGEEKEKDRMVIKGGADPRVYNIYAGVLAQQSLLTCFPYMITIRKVIYSVDVVKAFQQIEDRHKHSLGVLGVRIPAGLPEFPVENPFPEKYDDDQWLGLRRKAAVLILGAIHCLEKAHYGGRHAGNLFVFSLQFELQKDGEYTLVEEAVLVRREGAGRDGIKNGVPCKRGAASEVLVHYVDNIQGAGAKMLTILTQLGKNIKLGPIGELGEGGSDQFVGIDMEREGGKLCLFKKTYLKDIEIEKILQRAGRRRVTVDESMMEPPKEGEVDTSLTEEYGVACGILGWAASFFWKRRVFYDEL